MGQYYRPTFISEGGSISSLYSRDFGNGQKLMEHSYIGNHFVNAALCLLEGNPLRVAWIGDYANNPYDPAEDAYAKALPKDEFMRYYETVWGEKEQAPLPPSLFDKKKLAHICTKRTARKLIINHTKKQYIHLGDYIAQNMYSEKGGWVNGRYDASSISTWCVHPLPLLTACGNDRGGGDYHANHPGYGDVGIWAFDLLEFTSTAPKDYVAVSYGFTEKSKGTAS